MVMKFNSNFQKTKICFLNSAFTILFLSIETWSQMPTLKVPTPEEIDTPEDYTWWYAALFLLAVSLIGTLLWRSNVKKSSKTKGKRKSNQSAQKKNNGSLDADRELEWYRKNQKLMGGKKRAKTVDKHGLPALQNQSLTNRNGVGSNPKSMEEVEKSVFDLPVFSFEKIQSARPFTPLPISNDEALLSAIEQTHEELEEDEQVRELSVKILTAFKTRNSVEALSEVALYDLSASLRSKAVTTLSEFDHESVFETVLLACADPTREVKAAAARSLFRLSFDRANAWTRITESDEEGRVRQIARAAIEADLVARSLDRLIHEDHKIAQEAAAFTALMIRSGETEEIFNALLNHKKMNVRKAILHIIKITKNQKALEGLYSLLEQKNLPLELQEEVDKTIEEIGFVTV